MDVIALSHSAINTFDTCPRQYEAKYVTKEVAFVQSAEAKWGDDVHIALEQYGKSGTPIPAQFIMYKPYIDALLARPGTKVFEGQSALDIDGKPCGYFAKGPDRKNLVWLRAKIDVLNLRQDLRRVEVFDWKTGNVKDDPDQLVMYALFVFLHYPWCDEVWAGFSWLKQPLNKAFTSPVKFYRHQLPELLTRYRKKYAEIVDAIETGNFPKKQSGLCNGWCGVVKCEYHKPKRG